MTENRRHRRDKSGFAVINWLCFAQLGRDFVVSWGVWDVWAESGRQDTAATSRDAGK